MQARRAIEKPPAPLEILNCHLTKLTTKKLQSLYRAPMAVLGISIANNKLLLTEMGDNWRVSNFCNIMYNSGSNEFEILPSRESFG